MKTKNSLKKASKKALTSLVLYGMGSGIPVVIPDVE